MNESPDPVSDGLSLPEYLTHYTVTGLQCNKALSAGFLMLPSNTTIRLVQPSNRRTNQPRKKQTFESLPEQVSGFQANQTRRRSTDPQIHRSTDPQIHRSTDPQIHRSTDPQIHRSTDPQIHNFNRKDESHYLPPGKQPYITVRRKTRETTINRNKFAGTHRSNTPRKPDLAVMANSFHHSCGFES